MRKREEPFRGQAPVNAYGQPPFQAVAPGAEGMPTPVATARARQARRRRKTSGFVKFLVLLSLVTVAVVVAQQTVFRLETVYVIGNERKTPQQVVTTANLTRGRNMLTIEESEVAAALSRDHTLIFKGMQKEYPSTLYLYIEEREAEAAMQWLGMLYTLDGTGMVMAEENSAVLPAGLPVVTGFQAGSVRVGQTLSLRSGAQLEAYCEIMKELKLQMYADQVSEINLASAENLYLVTVEGVTVRLGDASYMRAKIGAVRTCMGRLRQLGNISGVLDVTTPEMPKYMPDH